MQILKVLHNIVILPLVMGNADFAVPNCAVSCWENTKYISKCLSANDGCLCSEIQYQKSVYQCIYSQCDGRHFASALHHMKSRCSAAGGGNLFTSPQTPNREELRRREEEYIAGDKLHSSGSVAGYPAESAHSPTESGFFPRGNVAARALAVTSLTLGIPPFVPTQSVDITLFPGATESPSPIFFRRDAPILLSMTTAIPTVALSLLPPKNIAAVELPALSIATRIGHELSPSVPLVATLVSLCVTLRFSV